MELTAWIDTLLVEVPQLWECLKSNTYPVSFLTNALGLRPESCARLPRLLAYFLGLYFLCGLVSAALRSPDQHGHPRLLLHPVRPPAGAPGQGLCLRGDP